MCCLSGQIDVSFVDYQVTEMLQCDAVICDVPKWICQMRDIIYKCRLTGVKPVGILVVNISASPCFTFQCTGVGCVDNAITLWALLSDISLCYSAVLLKHNIMTSMKNELLIYLNLGKSLKCLEYFLIVSLFQVCGKKKSTKCYNWFGLLSGNWVPEETVVCVL